MNHIYVQLKIGTRKETTKLIDYIKLINLFEIFICHYDDTIHEYAICDSCIYQK